MAKDEREEIDDEEDDDEDEDDEEEEETLMELLFQQEAEAKKKAKEKKDKAKFKKLSVEAPKRIFPFLSEEETEFVKKYTKKYKTEKMNITKFGQSMWTAQQRFWTKVRSIVSTMFSYPVVIVTCIVIGIVLLVAIIGYLLPFLFPNDEALGGKSGASSVFGIKGDSFYGARAVYKDDEKAKSALIEQYVSLIETTAENIEQNITTATVNNGEKDVVYTLQVDVVLELPGEDYDYENVEYSAFATQFPVVEEMAKFVYKIENGTEATISFEEVLSAIKYFGFSADLIGENLDDDKEVDNNLMEIVYDALTEMNAISIKEKDSADTSAQFVPATNVTLEVIDENIRTEVLKLNNDSNKIQTEKLFIKDFILEDEEAYIEGIEEKNYVALIYMPKQSVNIEYFCFMVTREESANFVITLTNGGKQISLSADDGQAYDENKPTKKTYMLRTSDSLSESVSTSTIINTGNLNMFTEDASLYQVLATAGGGYTTYLEETTSEDGDKYLTVKMGDLFVKFESDAPFMFTEETHYE